MLKNPWFLTSNLYLLINLKKVGRLIKMAATPKGPQKMKMDYNIDRQTYDNFIRACGSKGYAPQIILEKLMQRYIETGQV